MKNKIILQEKKKFNTNGRKGRDPEEDGVDDGVGEVIS